MRKTQLRGFEKWVAPGTPPIQEAWPVIADVLVEMNRKRFD
jgi:hypothetical protein